MTYVSRIIGKREVLKNGCGYNEIATKEFDFIKTVNM